MVIALAIDSVAGGTVHGVVRLATGAGVGPVALAGRRVVAEFGQVGGDAGQIRVAEILAAVRDHFRHGAADGLMLAATGFQQVDQRLLVIAGAANVGAYQPSRVAPLR